MQPQTRVCLEERSLQGEAGDAGPGPSRAAVALKHQVGLLHNPNVMFDFSWSAGLSSGNGALLMQRVGCSASNVQVPEHVISDEAVSSNTAAQPSLLVPLDPVPGAGRQKTPTRSRRCNSSAPQRFTRAPVARTLLVSPNASPSRCTSPLQLRNDASPARCASPLQLRNDALPARCASPLQLRNVAGGPGLGGATGKAGNCCRDPGFMAATPSSLSQSNQYDKHRRGVRKRKPRGFIASTRGATRFT